MRMGRHGICDREGVRPRCAHEGSAMTPETLYWVASIFLWLLFTGIGLPPVPEEAGILYAAGVAALHPEVPWWLAWPAAALGIIGADLALYGVGRFLGVRVFQYRW